MASDAAAVETTTLDSAPAAEELEMSNNASNTFDELDDLDLPPLRIHSKNRLSASSLQIPPGVQSQLKRHSLDSKTPILTSASPTGVGSIASSIASARQRGHSRSRSPSLRSSSREHRHVDSNASFSSLEDIVDPDILYDKMGFVELLDEKKTKKEKDGHSSYNALTPVSERMSEDTLEDVHAFSDLSVNSNTRPSTSVGTGGSTVGGEVSSHVLEPLYEGEDDDLESEDDADLRNDEERPSQVILTNLEKITLKDDAC